MVVILLAVTACGSETGRNVTSDDGDAAGADQPAESLVSADYDGRFRTIATVLESPQHGPQLCYGVDESLPPQCEGTDIAGWDWSTVDHEAANGTKWGRYTVIGTYDGDTFTLTEPAAMGGESGAPWADEIETPCPEPEDGWQPVDPALATEAAFQEAALRARDSDGFGGLWIDQQIPDGQITEQNANDPKRFVLNVTTTGDVEAMELALREVWGGSLCVSTASHTAAELVQVQRGIRDIPGLLSSGIDEVRGKVDLQVLVATEELQAELDERYGAGAVRLVGMLEPID
ncbi:MAG: hypothetical protein ACR2KV_10195 [Solirubrobacteraceae bacterium]